MNLYVMRHGTTVWNEKGITQGRTNNRLSKKGIELVKQVAKQYQNVKFVCNEPKKTLVRTVTSVTVDASEVSPGNRRWIATIDFK